MKTWAVLGGLWALTLTAGSFNWYYKYHPRTSHGWEPIRYRDVFITNYVEEVKPIAQFTYNVNYLTNNYINVDYITNNYVPYTTNVWVSGIIVTNMYYDHNNFR